MAPRMTSEVVRFGLVTGLSLGLDLAVTWGLNALAGLNLVLSVAAGFLVGATFNYIVHELWTFSIRSGRIAPRRWALYVCAMSFVLGLRLGVIGTLQVLAPGLLDATLLVLLVASAVSFAVNFVVSKFLIFRTSPA